MLRGLPLKSGSRLREALVDPKLLVPLRSHPSGPEEAERVALQPFLGGRLDPLDPSTSRHLGQFEFASETNAAVLRVVPKVKDGAGGNYWWVECGTCDTAWQVPYYAERVG